MSNIIKYLKYKNINGSDIEILNSEIIFKVDEFENIQVEPNSVYWFITDSNNKVVPILAENSTGIIGPQGPAGLNLSFAEISVGLNANINYPNADLEIKDKDVTSLIENYSKEKYPGGIKLTFLQGNNNNKLIRIILTDELDDLDILEIINCSNANIVIASLYTVDLIHYRPELIREDSIESGTYVTYKTTPSIKFGGIVKCLKIKDKWIINSQLENFIIN